MARPPDKIIATGETTWSTSPATKPKDKHCCGDDPDEGGFPYITSSIMVSGGIGKGNYQPTEIVCDDYTGGEPGKINPENWIDNNCNGKANCKDSSCYTPTLARGNKPQTGPSGGYCCSIPSNCHAALSETNNAYIGCSAETNWECDCLTAGTSIRSGGTLYGEYTMSSVPLTLPRTCINGLAIDKHIKIVYTGAFIVDELLIEDVKPGGTTCSGNVHVNLKNNGGVPLTEPYSAGPFFYLEYKNDASADCLVTVTIRPSFP
jgi:hypothetical protein